MPKRTGDNENQDYYKTAGGTAGRRTYARERRKLSESEKRATTPPAGHEPPFHKPSVAAAGAGTETAVRAQKRRLERERKQARESVEEDEVERMVESEVPRPPPQRLLPAASRSTELSDFLREVRDDLDTSSRALRELYASLASLMRIPVRLLRLLRAEGAS